MLRIKYSRNLLSGEKLSNELDGFYQTVRIHSCSQLSKIKLSRAWGFVTFEQIESELLNKKPGSRVSEFQVCFGDYSPVRLLDYSSPIILFAMPPNIISINHIMIRKARSSGQVNDENL